MQFAVDGANVGAPVTAAPYSVTWDSLGAANGTHTITARATDNAGNAATSAAVTVTVQNLLDTTNAFKKVDVGPGFMDAALHGVIRTPDGRVYIFAADDTAQRKATGPGVIHAYRAGQVGIPTSFTEADALHRPSATGVTHVVGSPDVRLAANGIAHMVYTDETNATLWYQTFSTVTDTWGPRVSLATGVDIPAVAIKRETSNALALDANDVPHVVYAGGGVVQYRNRIGGAWSTPVTVSSGGTPIHVSLTAVPDGTLDLAWLQGAIAPSTIRFAQRSAAGAWSAPETVATGDVLDNSNADQGPSVAYSATFEPYVLYVSGLPASAVRVRHRAGGAWTLDPTPTDFFTHTPQIYMTGNDVYAFLGHDSQIRYAYAFHLAGQALVAADGAHVDDRRHARRLCVGSLRPAARDERERDRHDVLGRGSAEQQDVLPRGLLHGRAAERRGRRHAAVLGRDAADGFDDRTGLGRHRVRRGHARRRVRPTTSESRACSSSSTARTSAPRTPPVRRIRPGGTRRLPRTARTR